MKKWSLNGKVVLVISILAFGAMVISFTGIRNLSIVNDELKAIISQDVKRDQLTSLITDEQRSVGIAMRDLIIERDLVKMKGFEENHRVATEKLYKYLNDYRALANAEGQKLADEYKSLADKWIPATKEVIKLAMDNKDAEVAAYRESTEFPMVLQMRAQIGKMNALTAKDLENSAIESQSNYEASRNLMLMISFISIFASLTLAFFILKAVTKAIDSVITGLTDSSNQVTSAAQQIASSSEELSEAATEQAASLEQTAASIQEMNSMVQKNAESAQRTSDLSNSSHEKAEKGKGVVQDMIRAIDDISHSNDSIKNEIDESNQRISEIVKVISEIGNKTKVINDIVFQTKLLSFNASVEAARAGEHGKGFAVVAEEVGNLAQMSGNAAKEISAMLEGSIQKVEDMVNETKQKVGRLILEGKSKVEAGTHIARQCGEVLEEIVENVANVTQMSVEISTACNEQALGVQEITKAMSQLDQVTQTNAATSEEAASAAEELSGQAESLRATVGVLRAEIKGGDEHGESFASTAKKPAATHRAPRSNVVSFNQHKAKAAKSFTPKSKKVVGLEGNIPLENDLRFEDV